jgi:hypothetical protein
MALGDNSVRLTLGISCPVEDEGRGFDPCIAKICSRINRTGSVKMASDLQLAMRRTISDSIGSAKT